MKIAPLAFILIAISACSSSKRGTSEDKTSSAKVAELKKLETSCNSGNGKYCDQLVTLLEDQQKTENSAKIISLLSRSCETGSFASCTRLGKIYSTPKVAEEDFTKAAELYEKACTASEWNACTLLAQLHYVGQGVDEDHKKSAALLQQACTHDDGAACNILGTQYLSGDGVQQSNDKALELFKQACNLKNDIGCQSLSKLQTKLHRYN